MGWTGWLVEMGEIDKVIGEGKRMFGWLRVRVGELRGDWKNGWVERACTLVTTREATREWAGEREED